MRPKVATILGFAAVIGLLCVSSSAPALAHETRRTGRLRLEVGWIQEPAYAGVPNEVEVGLSDAEGEPVSGANLQVEVGYADAVTTLALQPAAPGELRAPLEPTRPGRYTFRVVGKAAGRRVDERFVSGPRTFSPVEDPSALQFPASDPSTAEIATRLERETARLRASIDALAAERREGGIADAIAPVSLVLAALALGGVLLLARRGSPAAR